MYIVLYSWHVASLMFANSACAPICSWPIFALLHWKEGKGFKQIAHICTCAVIPCFVKGWSLHLSLSQEMRLRREITDIPNSTTEVSPSVDPFLSSGTSSHRREESTDSGCGTSNYSLPGTPNDLLANTIEDMDTAESEYHANSVCNMLYACCTIRDGHTQISLHVSQFYYNDRVPT